MTTAVADQASFSVAPSTLVFQAAQRQKDVTVKNDGRTTVTVKAPTFSGSDPAPFSVDDRCSNKSLGPGSSCTVTVTFAPTGLLKAYKANLVIQAREVPAATEVAIQTAVL